MTELEHARQRLAEIRAKYTRPSEAEYLRLLVAAWERNILILSSKASGPCTAPTGAPEYDH